MRLFGCFVLEVGICVGREGSRDPAGGKMTVLSGGQLGSAEPDPSEPACYPEIRRVKR